MVAFIELRPQNLMKTILKPDCSSPEYITCSFSQPRTPKQLLEISQGQDICATEIRLILPVALPPCDILKATLTWTQGFEYHIENHSVEKQ